MTFCGLMIPFLANKCVVNLKWALATEHCLQPSPIYNSEVTTAGQTKCGLCHVEWLLYGEERFSFLKQFQ